MPLVWGFQLSPPSFVAKIVPSTPATHPWLGSQKLMERKTVGRWVTDDCAFGRLCLRLIGSQHEHADGEENHDRKRNPG